MAAAMFPPVIVVFSLYPVNLLEELVPSSNTPEPQLLLNTVSKFFLAGCSPEIIKSLQVCFGYKFYLARGYGIC